MNSNIFIPLLIVRNTYTGVRLYTFLSVCSMYIQTSTPLKVEYHIIQTLNVFYYILNQQIAVVIQDGRISPVYGRLSFIPFRFPPYRVDLCGTI